MGIISNSIYEKYLVYPNESIDKLTVNRTFERLFEDIDVKTSLSSIKVEDATENSYGKAKFSSIDEYLFEKPTEQQDSSEGEEIKEYNNSMLTIGQLKNMSDRLSDGSYNAIYSAPENDETELRYNPYWVRSKYMDSKFLYMPNGINIVSCSFEIGFNGISNALSSNNVATEDVVAPVKLSSYSNQINIDQESRFNIEDYINDNFIDGNTHFNEINRLYKMDGLSMDIPFITDANVTLKHNSCGFNVYSSYRKSYIEICMSMKIGLKSLYELKFGHRKYEYEDINSNITDSETINYEEMKRSYKLFTQKPMVMAQIGFYNNDSVPRPLFGFDDILSGGNESEFYSYNMLSQKPLNETIVDDIPVSPVNGCVFVKRIENEYDNDGNIVDNIVHLDVVMKFMAGSASDPELEYALNTFNSRSKVQIIMIGV